MSFMEVTLQLLDGFKLSLIHIQMCIRDSDKSDDEGRRCGPYHVPDMIEILTDLKNKEDKIITEPIIQGTLNVVTTTGFHILQGELIKGEVGFIFLSNTCLLYTSRCV